MLMDTPAKNKMGGQNAGEMDQTCFDTPSYNLWNKNHVCLSPDKKHVAMKHQHKHKYGT